MNSKIKELVDILKKVPGGGNVSHFRYETSGELIRFPQCCIPAETLSGYAVAVDELLESAMKREDFWTVWDVWKTQDSLKLRVENFFRKKIEEATTFMRLDTLVIFLSSENLERWYTRLMELVTAQSLVDWKAQEWRRLEYVVKRPDKDDPEYLTGVFEWGQELFKEAIGGLSPEKYQMLKTALGCPFSLKLGGTDLARHFRN